MLVCRSSEPGSSNAKSHREYVEKLPTPTSTQIQHINEIQLQHEAEIVQKYRNREQDQAARIIQRAYRGHRERRHENGLILDPSERWAEFIREWQWRATLSLPREHREIGNDRRRSRAESDVAKMHWQRAVFVAEQVGTGPRSSRSKSDVKPRHDVLTAKHRKEEKESLHLDSRYFLEMVDRKHRYGPNLTVYHEEWQRSKINQSFFDWLDQGSARTLDLPGCSRERLDKERVRYLSREERANYLVEVDNEGRLRWAKNGELITTSADLYRDTRHGIVPSDLAVEDDHREDDVDFDFHEDDQHLTSLLETKHLDNNETRHDDGEDRREDTKRTDSVVSSTSHRHHHHVSPATILQHLLRATVRPGTWIYVADTLGRLYVGIKSSGAFQHTSFLSGGRISSAGSIGIVDGRLTYLSPLSGHYRPTTKSFRSFVASLRASGVDLSHMKTSKAYAILFGMECYSKTKHGMMKLLHHHHDGDARFAEKARS